MKKLSYSLLFILLSIQLIVIPSKVHAMDINVGLYSFYSIWEPSFKNQLKDYESDPMLLWGFYGALTFFEKLSISSLILQNMTNLSDMSYNVEGTGSLGAYRVNCKNQQFRVDWDLTVSYKFTGNITCFMGIKFMDLGQDDIGTGTVDNAYNAAYTFPAGYVDSVTFTSTGYAAGISYSIPLLDYFVLTAATSFLYTTAEIKPAQGLVEYSTDPGVLADDVFPGYYKYHGMGNNTTLNLAYFIESLSTSIILGGRFQVVYYSDEDDSPELDNDYFYGATLAAVLHI